VLVKIERKPIDYLEEEFNKARSRRPGRWKKLCESVKARGQGVEVTDISRGQAWSLARTAKEMNLRVRVLDKGTRVILLPPAEK